MTLCDIGNTTFAFFKNKKQFKISTTVKAKELPNIKGKIYFISVNEKATTKFRKRYPRAINLDSYLKFSTTYKGMGIDRKIACTSTNNGIIIDVGSAVTVDIMKEEKHLGGFILPGIKSLINLYPNISPKLNFNFEKDINLDKIPNNTNKAISYAIIQAIVQPIRNIEKQFKLPLIFTGGDAKYIMTVFKKNKYKKNLIFTTMAKIIKKRDK